MLAFTARADREAFTPLPAFAWAAVEPAAGAAEPPPAEAEADAASHAEADPASKNDAAHSDSGHGGEGESETKPKPKKSKGPPPLPEVMIGGQRVERAKVAEAAAEASVMPAALNTKNYPQLMQSRVSFTPYAHSPRFGGANAKLTVVIFEDLNCLSCTTASQVITTALGTVFNPPPAPISPTAAEQPIPTQVLWVYTPSSRFEGSNLPAFYGKVAARHGHFWPYREKLLQKPDRGAGTAFGVLSELGIEPRLSRQIMLSEARRFYRELDGDAQQARMLGIGNPPSVLVNGIRLGQHGLPLELLPDVLTYLRNRINAGMAEPLL
jgi:hypothetical protein